MTRAPLCTALVCLCFFAGQAPTYCDATSPAIGTGLPCGTTTSGRGIVSSRVTTPSQLELGVLCTWTFSAACPEQMLEVYFDEFNIGDDSRLEIYAGYDASDTSTLLTAYSGRSAASMTLILPNVITVLHRNSSSLSTRGFAFYFRSIAAPAKTVGKVEYECPTTAQIGSGAIVSPGNPGWYPANAHCKWVLVEEARGTPLRITFVEFSLEALGDYLRVYDGDVSGRLYAEYTGDERPVDIVITPTRGYVTLEFRSDNTVYKSGFHVVFQSEARSSGSTLPSDISTDSATSRSTMQYPVTVDMSNSIAVNDPFGCNHQYYFVTVPTDWYTGEQQCRDKFGGHLVKIDSVHEHNFLVDIIVNNTALNGYNYWIGGYSPSYPFSWRWTCGELPLNYGSTYYVAPWGEGRGAQPDISSELCIHIWYFLQSNIRYGWNNAYCNVNSVHGISVYSICEVCGNGAC